MVSRQTFQTLLETNGNFNGSASLAFTNSSLDIWNQNVVNGKYIVSYEIYDGLDDLLKSMIPKERFHQRISHTVWLIPSFTHGFAIWSLLLLKSFWRPWTKSKLKHVSNLKIDEKIITRKEIQTHRKIKLQHFDITWKMLQFHFVLTNMNFHKRIILNSRQLVLVVGLLLVDMVVVKLFDYHHDVQLIILWFMR